MSQQSSGADEIVLPDGSPATEKADPALVTERSLEREQEEAELQSVIVKRTDEATRHPDDILENAIAEGVEQLERPALSLFLSSIAGGMAVGFSGMAVGVVTTLVSPIGNAMLTRVATAAVYPLGFIICVMSGAQLFTEHTATAIYPIMDRRARMPTLLRLWGTVVVGNLAGALVIAFLLTSADGIIQAKPGYLEIGTHLTHFPTQPLFVSAILAGWLMALGAWLVMATPPDSSQIKVIAIVTFLIGLGGLHHSIAGSAEMLTCLLISDQFTLTQGLRFTTIALLGNTVGGSVFVGVLNYAHIRRTQAVDD